MVYFILVSEYVKIGHAKSVANRLHNLQAACPVEMELIGVMEGGAKEERELHRRFKDLWVRGEWFWYRLPIRQFVKCQTSPYRPLIHERREATAESTEVTTPSNRQRKRVRVWIQFLVDRPNLALQWFDPDTGSRRTKSAGTSDQQEAELRRADLETALNTRVSI